VNLSKGFLEKKENISPEVTIYSIVNSLVELPMVNKVQISVDGNSNIMYMEKVSLSQALERNLEIMENAQ
jgi:germination protein M